MNNIKTSINAIDFTVNYGNITGFTYEATGSTATDGVYTGLAGVVVSDFGNNQRFDISVAGGVVTGVTSTFPINGKLFSVGDTIKILGTDIDGQTSSDDVLITVTGVTSSSLFYELYTKEIFAKKGNVKSVSYYDENDILSIDSVISSLGYDYNAYSDVLSFPIGAASYCYNCSGAFDTNCIYTNQTANNMTELVDIFNTFNLVNGGTTNVFFDNNDGRLGITLN